ncbi:hypothetical protein LINGRAHAP2_LOCUS28255 [Linum grandiflorum]
MYFEICSVVETELRGAVIGLLMAWRKRVGAVRLDSHVVIQLLLEVLRSHINTLFKLIFDLTS